MIKWLTQNIDWWQESARARTIAKSLIVASISSSHTSPASSRKFSRRISNDLLFISPCNIPIAYAIWSIVDSFVVDLSSCIGHNTAGGSRVLTFASRIQCYIHYCVLYPWILLDSNNTTVDWLKERLELPDLIYWSPGLAWIWGRASEMLPIQLIPPNIVWALISTVVAYFVLFI